MKKLLIAIITIIMATCVFTGCGNSVKPLANVGGSVESGNGSFAVEKGDYVYFINGQEAVTVNNKFGEVEKASLVRIKTSDLAKYKYDIENVDEFVPATIETVIPKLFISASYKTGVFMYGDYVYYATPSTIKDKQSNVLNGQTQFFRFNLKTGKQDDCIAISEDNTVEYRFVQNNNTVYLVFTKSVTEDEVTTKSLCVYNADTRKEIEVDITYEELLMPEDNSSTIYFTKFGYNKENEENEKYHELYKYTIGATEADLVLSGSPEDLKVLQGATFTLIKNDGKYLFYKQTLLDTTNSSIKFYAKETASENAPILLGGSNAYISAAIVSNCYVKSLTEIYYMDSTTELSGFAKFNYTATDMTNGRTPINKDVAGYNFQFVENGYAYFSNSEGMYYRCDLEGNNFSQINGVAMKTATDWYKPRVIGNYFIGSYSNELYDSYVYVIDMTNIGEEAYDKYLEDVASEEEVNVKALLNTRIGIMTETDKEELETKLDEKFDKE
ncbi:MAG: hypothetical protein J6R29_00070 [Clostridia bacterium]|nr:hypothetical protein [Clostridia bacterium]